MTKPWCSQAKILNQSTFDARGGNTPVPASFRKTYRILNLNVTLETNAPELLQTFDRDYGLFACSASVANAGRNTLSIVYRSDSDGAGKLLRLGDTTFCLADSPDPLGYVQQLIGTRIMEENRDYLVIHAGVVARGGRTLILCGPPGVGKTTLVLELGQRGCTVFSDDFCPVHRETGLVHAFPRSVWIGEGSPHRRLLDTHKPDAPAHGNKRSVPLKKNQCATGLSCPAHSIICLEPDQTGLMRNELALVARCGPEHALVKAIGEMTGIEITAMSLEESSCRWMIRYPLGQGIARSLRAMIDTHRSLILTAHCVNRVRPNYHRSPLLTPMPRHEAMFFVLGQMKQEIQSIPPWHGADGSNAIRCFMELNELFQDVPCYRLTPGRLEDMANLALSTLT